MYNAVSKSLFAAVMSIALCSCGNAERDAANELSLSAENEVKAGNYEAAIAILDTLDTRYASEVEVRKSAMKYRSMAVEGVTIRRITVVDDTLAYLKAKLDELEPKFEYVENPGKGLGGNFVAKELVKGSYDISPRINDEGYFTVSVKIPRQIGFEHLSFIGNGVASSTNNIGPNRLVTVENSEMTVLQQEDVAQTMEWLIDQRGVDSYELVGSKSTIKQKFTAAMFNAFVETWQFAQAKQAYRLALIEREKLERKLQLCRNQLANVIDR